MKKIALVSIALFMTAAMLFANGAAESSKAGGAASLPKNIEVQVPAKTGGGTDVMARALAAQVASDSGSNLTIVNNSDGGGAVALEKVYAAKNDGSTILQFHTTMLIKKASGVFKRSAADDYKVIAVSVQKDPASYTLVVDASSPYKTVDDLVAAAKANPGSIKFGVETGGTAHIITGLFAKAAGIQPKIVEAGTDTEKMAAVVGKTIDACFVNPNQAKQYVDAGKVVALAVVSRDEEGGRCPVFPELKSFPELGYKFAWGNINLFLGPKTMDDGLARQLHDYYANAYENPTVKNALEPKGFGMEFLSYEDGLARVKSIQADLDAVVGELGLKK